MREQETVRLARLEAHQVHRAASSGCYAGLTRNPRAGLPMTDLRLAIVTTLAQMNDALTIRCAVFIDEQGVSEKEEIDEYDGDPAETTGVVHVVAYRAGVAVATGRLMVHAPPGEHAHIGRVAVLAEYRKQGLGRAVMLALHNEARTRGYAGVALGAQLPAIPFYETLGYVASGEVYLDAGMEHRWMDLSFGG